MNGPLILAIDQGTTNSKALVLDRAAEVVADASRPVPISYPRPGWVEQDPRVVLETVVASVDEVLAKIGTVPDILALTNQRESALLWDRGTGDPVSPLVSWQCRRSYDICERLRSGGAEEEVRDKTGLPLDPLFSAGKLKWLLDSDDGVRARAERGELCGGTIDSWLLWNLTGGAVHATDVSNASRTQLYDIYTHSWSQELLDLFDIPGDLLPEVQASSGIFGTTAAIGDLSAGLPIAAMVGDSHGALYGHGCDRPGPVKVTYGTGSSLMTLVPGPVRPSHGLSVTIAWSRRDPVYALEANISATGAAIEWMARILDLPGVAAVDVLAADSAAADGLFFVPAMSGLAAPHWESEARSILVGMTRATGRSQLARAALEAVAFQVRDVLEVLEVVSPPDHPDFRVLYADGGASRSEVLMQIQADLTGWSVARADSPHLAAAGSAYLAGLAEGIWDEDEVRGLTGHRDHFVPRLKATERDESYQGWRDALLRAFPRESETKTSERKRWPASMN